MNNIHASLFFVSLIVLILGLGSCTTDPIVIEIPAEAEMEDSLSIINIMETDLCETGVVSFEREVLPILVSSCAHAGCHDEASAQGLKILTEFETIMYHVSPNEPTFSSLYLAVSSDPVYMPPSPRVPLNEGQIQRIEEWIIQGAENTMCNTPCSSTDRSFNNDIFPLIQNHCIGCHQPNNALGGISLIDYESIANLAMSGDLLAAISHEVGYSPMPKLLNKLTDCQIGQIQNWIVEGAQNN